MLQKIFTVYDSKVEAFMTPFFMPHRGAALRAFEDLVNDPKSNVFKYPSDFTLFEIGEYDDSNGSITMLDAKHNLCVAVELQTQMGAHAAVGRAAGIPVSDNSL